jgi:twitching motility protein PilT
MSLMPSLCAALERANGDRLVMRAGERPHVLAGDRRHDVASAVLSVNAVEALAEQVLSAAARETLTAQGAVSERVHSTSFPRPLMARAERVGDDFCIELIASGVGEIEEAPQEPQYVPQPEPVHEAPPAPEAVAAPPVEVAPPPAMSIEPEPDPVRETPVAEVSPLPAAPPVAEAPYQAPPPAEPAYHAAPEPAVRRPDVTVVARVHEPVRMPRPAAYSSQDLFSWIGHASALGATTLYLRGGSPASARIDDRIQPISQDLVEPSVIEEAASTFTRGGDGLWEPRADGEWVREDDEVGSVSCRVFTDLQGTGLIIQLRPSVSLRLLHKHIPRQVRVACEGNGLVIVAAPTEADVEALAAAVADWSGRDRGGYLIALQRRTRSHGDIAGAFVSQRTVGGSEKDFALAIRRATQEGPDILLVTGLQSEQSLQAAVLAAAGGRLVILGVVAPATVDALKMLAGTDSHVRRTMAATFRAAIGYRSLRRIGGGRTLVQDIILPTTAITGLLEAGDFDQLARTQREGAPGVRPVDESLARAVRRGHITLREAVAQAIDPRHMVALVRAMARAHVASRPSLANPRVERFSGGAHAARVAGGSSLR